MSFSLKKRYVIPAVGAGLLYLGASFKEDFFEVAKQIEIFTNLFKAVNTNYVDQVNPAQLMDGAIKKMLADLDPYTVYFNEQDVVKFKINSIGEYTGIGALTQRKDGHLIIREPYKDYPADKAGLKAGDEIVEISGVKVQDYKEDVSQLLKGAKNTKIDIRYKRQGKIYDTQLVMTEVDVKAVPYFAKIGDKTGYIALTQFNRRASLETKEALEQLKREGATQLILDLRGNPGGLLNEAVNICSMFVPKGETIVTTKSKLDKHNNTYKTTREPIDLDIPIVVLVDGKSASASEIVAGALQDLDRAVVVGSRSFGKGLVQRPIDLTYGTQIKITISRYYTPSGRCIQSLDYSTRDAEGNAVRTAQDKFNAFKTRNGRTVYDGGGIQPDIEIAGAKLSAVAEALQKNDGIFNFATEYYYKNPNPSQKIPQITDADFASFKQFLKREKFSMDSKTELALREVLEAAKDEKLNASIQSEYAQLKAALERGEERQIDENQNEIRALLQDELIRRYQYKEGLYAFYTQNNAEVKKAIELLSNVPQYQKILKR